MAAVGDGILVAWLPASLPALHSFSTFRQNLRNLELRGSTGGEAEGLRDCPSPSPSIGQPSASKACRARPPPLDALLIDVVTLLA